jgi:hypothetical protein
METYLTLNNQLRTETDSTTIANLLRKGWEYAPDKPSNNAVWQDGQWVLPPPPPDYKVWQNVEYFLSEFTMEEMAAIALSTDPTIAALRLLLSGWFSEVRSNDPRVMTGLNALESNGVLTAERISVILSK